MNIANTELIKYIRKYQNKWVALAKGTSNVVLASDKNLKKLVKKADAKSEKYVLEKVLPLGASFAPYSH